MEEWRGSLRSPRAWHRWGDWRQAKEYAILTDFMWLRKMNLVLDDPKKEAVKGMCPCHRV